MPLDELVVDEVVEDDKLKIFVDLYFWFSKHLIDLYISIAESLGLRETPLSNYRKRVRWTCVCGCRLYDDFCERVPGAVQTLQRHLDHSDLEFAQTIRAWCYVGRSPPDIKKRYSKAKGIFGGFLSPPTVKTIRATHSDRPVKIMHMIGPNYLMHLWQNPHHTDWHTYQKNKSVLETVCWVMRKLLDLARMDNGCAGRTLEKADDTLADNQSWRSETKQHTFRESYVFHTIPKSPGVELDREAIENGFMLLIEGFQFRQFLVLVAVILWFTVYGLVFGVHFRYVAGLQGPKLHPRLVEISSWITGPLMLIIALRLR